MRYLFIFLLFSSITALAQQVVAPLRAKLLSGPDTSKINTYLEISKIYTENEPDSAVDYANRGMRLAEKLNDRHGEAMLLLQLGRVNTFHRHNDLARRFYNEALSIFRNLH